MRKIIIAAFLLFALSVQHVAAQTAEQLHETAKGFMRSGDYINAVLVLDRLSRQDPANIEYAKDLSQSYYFQGQYDNALKTIKPWLDNENSDDQSFQIAGDIYQHTDNPAEAEKAYKKGLKKFPDSGPLYNDLGELKFAQKDYTAIKDWENGIAADPAYSRNYYNAARYYFLTTDRIRSILYGEIFVNMEPGGDKTPEIKQVLLDSYKKFFAAEQNDKAAKDQSAFEKEVADVLNRQSVSAAGGITTESLTMIRTRFIIDWFAKPDRPAFHLFDMEQQLLKEGLFDAYDQWLFGSVENLSAYFNWVKTHASENNSFIAFQKNRVFKMPAGQYYAKR